MQDCTRFYFFRYFCIWIGKSYSERLRCLSARIQGHNLSLSVAWELCSSAKVSWTFSVRCSKRTSTSVQDHVVFPAAHPLHQLRQLKSLRQSVWLDCRVESLRNDAPQARQPRMHVQDYKSQGVPVKNQHFQWMWYVVNSWADHCLCSALFCHCCSFINLGREDVRGKLLVRFWHWPNVDLQAGPPGPGKSQSNSVCFQNSWHADILMLKT